MTRRIDHLVLAVHDLDAAADFYRGLGFTVGARNRHSWGTENALVQFQSSFLELITVGKNADIPPHAPNHFSFGAYVRDYLARREGLAMVVLDSDDAEADSKAFAKAGIADFAPFFFERKGQRPDGSATHVAFTLAFAIDQGLHAAFFVCQQHFPEAFWSHDLQQHQNGATNVTEVTLEAAAPASHTGFLRAFSGVNGDTSFDLSKGGVIKVNQGVGNRAVSFSVAADQSLAGTVVEAFGVEMRFV